MQFGERVLQDKEMNDEMLQNQSGLHLCRKKMGITLLIYSGTYMIICIFTCIMYK